MTCVVRSHDHHGTHHHNHHDHDENHDDNHDNHDNDNHDNDDDHHGNNDAHNDGRQRVRGDGPAEPGIPDADVLCERHAVLLRCVDCSGCAGGEMRHW